MDIKNNINFLQREVAAAGAQLIAVSKTQPVETIREAYDAGQRIFGENKAQEMTAKVETLPRDIAWHMIGHLQTNKVNSITPFITLVHSVDSQKLMDEINKQGKKINRVIHCLLQVHIAQEETKFGFDEQELLSILESPAIADLNALSVQGLMGMASLTADKEKIRNEFRNLKNLFEKIKSRKLPSNGAMTELSMGMSSDYKIALAEGSTLVRIGTAIFGERR